MPPCSYRPISTKAGAIQFDSLLPFGANTPRGFAVDGGVAERLRLVSTNVQPALLLSRCEFDALTGRPTSGFDVAGMCGPTLMVRRRESNDALR